MDGTLLKLKPSSARSPVLTKMGVVDRNTVARVAEGKFTIFKAEIP